MIHSFLSTIAFASVVALCSGASTVQRKARVMDPCASKPCQNGGSCWSTSDLMFECHCLTNNFGPLCEETVEGKGPCESQPCENGGICHSTSQRDYECECPDHSSNYPHCEQKEDPCKSQPCGNGAICHSLGHRPDDYRCEKEDPCLKQPCMNGGSCRSVKTDWDFFFECVCAPGFSGRWCQFHETCCGANCAGYRGKVNTTATGRTCQRWDAQYPHTHGYKPTPARIFHFGLVDNYCRNPSNHHEAWCYTTDKGKRWERCDVPACEYDGSNY